jgi:hypothetical protein
LQEVGARPEAHIEDFYQRILAVEKPHQKRIKFSGRDSIDRIELEAGPMVGRTEEWRKLLALWQNTASGKAQIGLIIGEAGIGKTRLISDLENWAVLQSIPIDTAVCHPADGSLPYGH